MITFLGAVWPASLTPKGVVAQGCLYDHTLDATTLSFLPDQLQFAAPKRQAEFLAGRACVVRALAQLGSPDTDVGIGSDRAPIWPSGVVGSITHAKGYAAALVALSSASHGLGIDTEQMLADDYAAKLMPQVGSSAEWALLLDHFPAGQAFAVLFSAKEALYKAVYPKAQRFIGFEEVVCVACDARTRLITVPRDVAAKPNMMDVIAIDYVMANQRVYTLCHLTG